MVSHNSYSRIICVSYQPFTTPGTSSLPAMMPVDQRRRRRWRRREARFRYFINLPHSFGIHLSSHMISKHTCSPSSSPMPIPNQPSVSTLCVSIGNIFYSLGTNVPGQCDLILIILQLRLIVISYSGIEVCAPRIGSLGHH